MDLNKLRKLIDTIDEKLIMLLVERKSVVLEIGKIKKNNGDETIDPKREEELKSLHKKLSDQYHLEDTEKIFDAIIQWSRNLQK